MIKNVVMQFKASLSYFGKTNFRNTNTSFGILQKDRLHHFYVLGKTGTGKTTLLHTKILQDILYSRGLCLIDIHGDLIQKVKTQVPKSKLIYLDATDTNMSFGYNPLRKVSKEKQALVVSSILETFQRVWGKQAWGIKLAHILRNILLTLLVQADSNFSDITKILHDMDFRARCLAHVQNKHILDFWNKEFPSYSKNDLLPIYNKIGGLLLYPSLKRILIDNKRQISLRRIMDEGKVLLVNVSKGSIGKEPAYILASLLVTALSSASFSRIDTPEERRRPFFLYFDEFQNYTNLSLIEMLSELRKFKIGVIMAHQYLNQLEPAIRDAVLGNVGSIVSFRLSYQDAKLMEKEFHPIFCSDDFINLQNQEFYIKMMIQGAPSRAFSARGIHQSKFEI